jgi:hypothetical protein
VLGLVAAILSALAAGLFGSLPVQLASANKQHDEAPRVPG